MLFCEGGGNKIYDQAQTLRPALSIAITTPAVGVLGNLGHVTWGRGPFGSCLVGDGTLGATAAYRVAFVPDTGFLTTSSGCWSFSVWLKPNASVSDYGAIMTSGQSSGFWMRGSNSGANNLLMDVYFGGDHMANIPFIDGVWNHYVFTQLALSAGSTGSHYVNGVFAGSVAMSSQAGFDCMFSDPISESYKGSIDLPFFWGQRILTPGDVLQLYKNPLCMFKEPQSHRLATTQSFPPITPRWQYNLGY
jgi:hypothetical protein